MTIPSGFHSLGLSRRSLLVASAVSILAAPTRTLADKRPFRVGYLPFGTVQWEISALLDAGFEKSNGLKIEMVQVATGEASRIAFLSGSVDTVVQDLLIAARLKADGKSVQFLPQSSTEGELVVAADSPIHDIAGLRGKSIGVAGGPVDKNWVFLRAAALQQANLDLTKDAKPVFGAPPLLAAKVERGELDAGLLYWSTAARLKAKGYRHVTSTEEILTALGAKGKVAVSGYLFQEGADPEVLAAFSKALRQTENVLATSSEAWRKVRPLMKAHDEATFQALKEAYLRGIPRKSRAEEIADARSFFAIVKRVGGTALLGPARDLPDDLYVDQAIYG